MLVTSVGVDQVTEQPRVEVVAVDGRPDRRDARVRGVAVRRRVELIFEPVEGGKTIADVAVADVVGETGEPVNRQQIATNCPRQHAQSDGKVLGGDLCLHLVEAGDARRRRLGGGRKRMHS
jgi:hypothetical protein